MRRSSRPNPVVTAIGCLFAIGIAILLLPPLVRFVAFLMSGDIWRALTGVALISFVVGLVLAGLIGFFDRREPAGDVDEAEPRQRGRIWLLVWAFLLATPACLVVALIASGTLVDSVQWSGDRISEIRDAQGSS